MADVLASANRVGSFRSHLQSRASRIWQAVVQLFNQVLDSDMLSKLPAVGVMVLVDPQTRVRIPGKSPANPE
jgi:hypothetical protein